MKIFENIHPQVDVEKLLRGLGGDRKFPQICAEARWACDIVEELARPRAIAEIFHLERGEADTVRVVTSDGLQSAKLAIGKRGCELLAGAECVQISFVTLGGGVQPLVDELKTTGQMLKDYILDTALILALHYAGQFVNQLAETTAKKKGWGVGRRLSPGDLRSWALEEQDVLAGLLPIAKIGIEIRNGSLLYPLKSASSLIGMGPGYGEDRVGTVCQWCRNQKTCPIRLCGLDE